MNPQHPDSELSTIVANLAKSVDKANGTGWTESMDKANDTGWAQPSPERQAFLERQETPYHARYGGPKSFQDPAFQEKLFRKR
jgi:hypothetical protein